MARRRNGKSRRSSGSGRRIPLRPGIDLAALGDNWEIYLNGTLVRSEMHLDGSGAVASHRYMRDIFFPVDPALLLPAPATNILAVRIIGDPTYPPSGMYQTGPYLIGDYREIQARNDETLPVVLIGLYLFIGLYHLFINAVRRRDRYNLFYGLFSMDLAVYLFTRTHTIYRLIVNTVIIEKIELASLFILLPLVGAFLETLNRNRIGRITKAYAVFCAVLAAAQAVFPLPFAYDLLRVWQASGLVMALYYFGYGILYEFVSSGYRRWKRLRDTEKRESLALLYLKTLGTTASGNLLIGGFILLGTAVFDIVDAVSLHRDLVLTQYGFFLFTMGTALILANRFSYLHTRLSDLNVSLEERIRSLTETSGRLEMSEKKYRSLFEGTSDAVALLDSRLHFLEGNSAARELFGLDRPGREGLRLPDLLHGTEKERAMAEEQIALAIAEAKGKKEAEETALRLKTGIGEPRTCRVRIEPVLSIGAEEILLRVSPERREEIIGSFVEERQKYVIGNTLSEADDICRRAVSNLTRYLDEETSAFLMVCLREIVLNAVEHGNLEIGFEEKSEAQRNGTYFEFILRRQKEKPYSDRRVAVEYSITPERATFRVTDDGNGFDHGRFASPDPRDLSVTVLEHGRGIFMARNAFDKLIYNEKGNQVTLVKYLKRNAEKS
jgi:PAS domain S-box-containing protein